jgi:hypothetical protein
MTRRKIAFLVSLALALGILLAACQTVTPTAAPSPNLPPPTAAPTVGPTPTAVPTARPVVGAPNMAEWMGSPHNDTTAEAFKHWDTTADKSVPVTCAQCHTTSGYQDFLGADGSAVGKVDKPVAIGETINCNACHNSATAALTAVTFQNGVKVTDLGPEARCMECHQGRATQKSVDDQIAKFKATDPDAVVPPITNADNTKSNFGFINVHYFAAALTLYGGQVNGAYQYAGQTYDYKNQHTQGVDTCVACHDPHTTNVQTSKCAECHTNVKGTADLQNIREVSSEIDYNGNGNVKEGIAAEVKGMEDNLTKAIQAYAKDVIKVGIVYDPATNPYFFQDKNNTGKPDKDDKGAAIAYANWTPRLLEAAYNLQVAIKDPGAFAHNPKYTIEFLYDSASDLNSKLTTKIDMSKMHRDDAAHFAGNTTPFRDWDATGEVPAGCARCHSAGGLPQFLHNGGKLFLTSAGLQVTGVVGQPVANGFQCTTCHDGDNFPNRLAVTNVQFPSGATLTFSTKKDDKGNLVPVDANLCLECHQGRESTASVNMSLTAFKDLDKADPKITFRNVHYLAAGATLFGTNAKGMYEYTGKTYLGQNMHTDGYNTCTDCHDAHTQEVKVADCASCHNKSTDPKTFRKTKDNYIGSKDNNEPMAVVVDTFKAKLYATIQKYAKDKAGTAIVYDPASYPYFFLDKDGDGKPDVDAKGSPLSYNAFTPRLVEAAYNLQYVTKDPGAFAHNPKYVIQGMYDSIQDLGGDMTGLVRP